MKNLFKLLIVLLVIFSCSKDDENNLTQDSSSINPPNWIIGTWTSKLNNSLSFRFTENDFCTGALSVYQCYKGSIQQIKDTKGYVKVKEEKSDTDYKITISMGGSAPGNTNITHHFKRASNNIIWVQNVGNTEFVKE